MALASRWDIALLVPESLASLSPRQLECLRLVADLKDTQQIAHLLGLSPHTVDSYIREAVRLLGASNRRHAAAMLRDVEAAREPAALPQPPPEKIGYDFPRDDLPASVEPSLSAQSGGEAATGEAEMVNAVREMPKAYHAEIRRPEPSSWWPLPGEDRRPSSISPLRRLILILALVLGLGAGIGIAVLTVAGAIVVSERTRP